jgi:hypothetical protein
VELAGVAGAAFFPVADHAPEVAGQGFTDAVGFLAESLTPDVHGRAYACLLLTLLGITGAALAFLSAAEAPLLYL